MKTVLIFCILSLSLSLPAQMFSTNPLAHTYSIIAVDSVTGQIGAAVQSHWFSVGSNVIWAEAGVGAVATQSFTNSSFGPKGLDLMKNGTHPEEALDILLSEDDGREFRQVALIDINGISVAHTGEKCIAEAGHTSGTYYSMQANLMLKNTVWEAMKKAFLTTKAPLAERLVAALEAAETEGGDIRGKQSAALLVVRGTSTGRIWEDHQIDLRVEDHPEPVKEIKRLLLVHRAYEHMNAGDIAIEEGNEKKALREYSAAGKLQPDNLEMQYWHAISLLNLGKYDDAYRILGEVFAKDTNWKTLTPRLVAPGILTVDKKIIEHVMNL